MSNTNDKPTPAQVMSDLAGVHDDPAAVVADFTTQVRGKALSEYVHGLLIEKAREVMRSRTRSVELEVDAEIRAGVSPVAARKKLRGEVFVLPTGEYVEWLHATDEQHDLRAEYLENKANGILVTAQRHRTAAADIRAAGVTCLADIEDAA